MCWSAVRPIACCAASTAIILGAEYQQLGRPERFADFAAAMAGDHFAFLYERM